MSSTPTGTTPTKSFFDLTVEAGTRMISARVEMAVNGINMTNVSLDLIRARGAAYQLGKLWTQDDDWNANPFLKLYPELNKDFFKGATHGLIKDALSGPIAKTITNQAIKKQTLSGEKL